jgi:adenylosuccinate lyase
MANPDVLSERYATDRMNEIFSVRGRILLERELWIAVARAQRKLGVRIPAGTISRYEAAKKRIDLALIGDIERRTQHDLAARIEAFDRVAGTEGYIHLGMTSRDVTDNVEGVQIRRAAEIIFGKYISILRHLVDRARAYDRLYLVARTHHQPAQPTVLGRRLAMWAEELCHHLRAFEFFIQGYPLRGLKGPVGTQSDMFRLLGSRDKVDRLEQMVARKLGFRRVLDAPGQVYPRSLDYAFLAHLAILASAPENFAKGMRLMAGQELITEGFAEGQVGSSAMPHKMNTRSAERICALAELIKAHADGASRLAGDQWEEGDVSCSAVRRATLPDACYASDGLCEATLTVLNRMKPFPGIMRSELDRFLPFLATSEILLAAVEHGIPRDRAHGIIRRHATAELRALRERGRAPQSAAREPRLAARLAQDPAFRKAAIGREEIESIQEKVRHSVGNAVRQIGRVTARARRLIRKYPAEARYEPEEIL